jgi:hypothetical protein
MDYSLRVYWIGIFERVYRNSLIACFQQSTWELTIDHIVCELGIEFPAIIASCSNLS